MYNAKITDNEDKLPNIAKVATNATFNAKINEMKGKIPSTINLATTTALTEVENKIHNFSNLV